MKIEFLNNLFVQFFNSINNVIFNVVPNKSYSYGLTIITLTILIKIVLIPLNIKMIKSSVGMNELQPLMKELQKKYKSDPQKLNQETMKLYKEHNVSPFGGCLPMLIQWPILVALYYVFYSLNIKGIGFLWISDLSKSATFSNWTTWILPILSGATTYFSGILLTAKNADEAMKKQSTTMNIGMSVMFLWMSWKFKAALVLYWTVSNIFQFVQTKVIMALVSKKPEQSNIITESGVDKAVGVDSIKGENAKRKNKGKKTK